MLIAKGGVGELRSCQAHCRSESGSLPSRASGWRVEERDGCCKGGGVAELPGRIARIGRGESLALLSWSPPLCGHLTQCISANGVQQELNAGDPEE